MTLQSVMGMKNKVKMRAEKGMYRDGGKCQSNENSLKTGFCGLGSHFSEVAD